MIAARPGLIGALAVLLLGPSASAQTLTVSTVLAGAQSFQPLAPPSGIAVDPQGNLYVNDGAIKKILPDGSLQLLAGSPQWGVKGSADGTGAAAGFNDPTGLAADRGGNVYVADSGNDTIRKITPAGVVTTIAGVVGLAGDHDGPAATALFSAPTSVALDASGNLYVADAGNSAVRKLGGDGTVSTLAIVHTANGWLNGIAVDSAGNVYVSDAVAPRIVTDFSVGTNTIDKISPTGVVTLLAGQAGFFGGSDGTGAAATFSNPSGLAVDRFGNVFVADQSNSTIREISPAGVVTTVAGLGSARVGTTSQYGIGSTGFVDGTGMMARLAFPTAVAVDASGTVFIADSENIAVRRGLPTANTASPVRFTDISTLGTVAPATPLTVGFVIAGTVSQTVLIRAIGPSLQALGVAHPLPSPQFILNGGGQSLASSADGVNQTGVQSASALVGAFPLPAGGGDAAAVIELAPGAYSLQVTSGDGSTGAVLAEVYEVP